MNRQPLFWQRLRGLRAKFIGIFLLLMLIPMLEIVVYGYFFTGSALSQQAVARSEQEVHLQAEQFIAALTQSHNDLLYLAQLPSFVALRQAHADQSQPMAAQAQRRREATQDLLVMLAAHPMYQSIRWLDADGDEIVRVWAQADGVSAVPAQQLTDRSTSAYFKEVTRLAPFEAFVSPFGADQEADVSVPTMHYSLNLGAEGVLVLDVYVDWLLRGLPKNVKQDMWAIIDQYGAYLVYPSTFTPSRTDANGHPYIHKEMLPLLAAPSGVLAISGNVYVFERIVPSPATPEKFWVLYHMTPRAALFASVEDFYLKALLFLGGALALAVLLAVLTSNGITASILELKHMAEAFGQGGKAPKPPVHLPADEIGALTRTFCEMAQELERKRHESKLLIDRLISAQEEERKLVAYDLHDGLIQQLVGARLYLSSCRQNCPMYANGIQRGCEALSEAISEGRRIIEGLRPSTLDDLGVVAAIDDLARRTAQAVGWSLQLDLHSLPQEPEKSVSVTLYRIAQEALNNARKHASASQITVQLHNGNGITLRVSDNGSGFDPTRTSRGGFGITTMRERAELLGGTCTIESARGHGTTIAVWIPPQVYPYTNQPNSVRVMSEG